MADLGNGPEANIPCFNPIMRSNAQPPRLLDLNAKTEYMIYDESTIAPNTLNKADQIFIQNVGNTAIMFVLNMALGQNAWPPAAGGVGNYNGVLAGGAAADDGKGGMVQFFVRQNGIKSIIIYGIEAGRAIVQAFTKY